MFQCTNAYYYSNVLIDHLFQDLLSVLQYHIVNSYFDIMLTFKLWNTTNSLRYFDLISNCYCEYQQLFINNSFNVTVKNLNNRCASRFYQDCHNIETCCGFMRFWLLATTVQKILCFCSKLQNKITLRKCYYHLLTTCAKINFHILET